MFGAGAGPSLGNVSPYDLPAGLRILVPGWPQARWKQPVRTCLYCVLYWSAILTTFVCWGTLEGWAAVVIAFGVQTSSAVDAIAQSRFPLRGGTVSDWLIVTAVFLCMYVPVVIYASEVAWPGFEPGDSHRVYLVDYLAYRSSSPRDGDWIWMRMPRGTEAGVARVIALPGQEVEWTGRRWKIDGRALPHPGPMRAAAWPLACRFRVPDNEILVEPEYPPDQDPPAGPIVLVPEESVMGRAWARFYPIWERRLL
jgi:hypothetical protein